MSRFFAPAVDAKTAGLLRRLVKSLPDDGRHLPAILTYPVKDYQGDEVVPDGGDWSRYPSDPVVNWEHEEPVGRGAVELKAVTLPHGEFNVPVGTTKFFESAACLKGLSLNRYGPNGAVVGKWAADDCLRLAEQGQRLVADGIVTGVSLEFEPRSKKSLGRSALLRRDAYRFEVWDGLGWAHTASPVNPGAQLVRAEKALKYLQTTPDDRLPETIRKSLRAATAPLINRPVSATVPAGVPHMARVTKAGPLDPPELDDMAGATGQPEPDGDEGANPTPAGDGPTPAVKTLTDGSQMLMDLCSQMEAGMGQSEHMKAKKYCAAMCDKLQKLAGEMAGMADKVQAELGGESESEPEPDEDADKPETDDADGSLNLKAFKSLSAAFPSYKPKRLSLADLRPAKVSKGAKTPDAPATVPAGKVLVDKAEWDELQRETAALLARLS